MMNDHNDTDSMSDLTSMSTIEPHSTAGNCAHSSQTQTSSEMHDVFADAESSELTQSSRNSNRSDHPRHDRALAISAPIGHCRNSFEGAPTKEDLRLHSMIQGGGERQEQEQEQVRTDPSTGTLHSTLGGAFIDADSSEQSNMCPRNSDGNGPRDNIGPNQNAVEGMLQEGGAEQGPNAGGSCSGLISQNGNGDGHRHHVGRNENGVTGAITPYETHTIYHPLLLPGEGEQLEALHPSNAENIRSGQRDHSNIQHLPFGITEHSLAGPESNVATRDPGCRHHTTSFKARLFSILSVCVALVFLKNLHETNRSNSAPEKNPPSLDRHKRSWICGNRITYGDVASLCNVDKPLDGPRERAISWFATGAGRNITLDDCTSPSSPFSILYSLLVLRETSIGMSNNLDWYTEKPLQKASDACAWRGVHCTAGTTKEIEKLTFNNADLHGTIPPEVARLDSLISLQLYTNRKLNGMIPTEIGQLSRLETLYLQHTSLSGSIPSEIGNLVSLREFHFDNTPLSGTMPNESICKLFERQLESLRGTCNSRVYESCDCCTSCKQPGTVANELPLRQQSKMN